MSNMERRAKQAAEAQGELADANNDLIPTIGHCTAGIGQNADASTIAAAAVSQYADATANAQGPIQSMADSSLNAAAATRNLFDAATNVAEAEDKLRDSIKKNGSTMDAHTKKGQANRDALSGVVGELNASYKAYVAVNGEGSKSNKVLSSNYNSFIKTATGAGISASAARGYARQLGLIPPKKQTDFTANTHDAAGRIAALQDKVNGLHGKSIQVTIDYNYRIHGKPGAGGGLAHGGIKGAANGATSSDLTWVGENGPELMDLPPGTSVHTAGDSRRMATSQDASGGMSGPIIIQIDGKTVFTALLPHAQKTNRNRYGNDAQRMLAG
jgi:hypothetical protein